MPVLGTAATQLPQDLEVMDNGMVFAGDRLDHLWFNLVETEAGQEYHLHRVVCLKMLRYLPQEARQDAGLLDTMRSALTGLYNQRLADYDPCSVVAGIFDPPLGVIQCYGVVGLGHERTQATHNANLGMGAIEGVMANFAQSRLEALDIQKAEWLRQAFLDMPFSLVTIGQPDPRQAARGMGREGPAEKSITMTGETAYTMQQNEMLFRALARLEEEFLFLVLASRVAQRDLAVMLEGISSEASVPASRQTGAKSISFGLSFPLAASGSLGQSIGTAYGRNEGQSLSEGLSESEATSHTEGTASTVGHAVTEGTAHTVGTASTSGGSASSGVSITEGTNRTMGTNQGVTDTVGRADSVGTADTRGSAHTVGTASTSGSFSSSSVGGSAVNTVGTSVTHAESSQVGMNVGRAAGQSVSHSEGSAEAMNYNQNVGVDGRVSILGIGGGVSEGVGRGRTATESVGDSVGNNQSASWGASASRGVSDSNAENQSVTSGSSWGSSSGSSHSSTRSSARTTSQAHTDSASHTESSAQAASRGESVSEGVSGSVTRSVSQSSFASTTQSVSDTTSRAETDSWSRTNSVSDGTSHGVTRSRSGGRTSGTSVGRAMGVARTMGMSAAVVPSISAAKSYQWYDDKAVQLTAMLRAQEELLRQATLEGCPGRKAHPFYTQAQSPHFVVEWRLPNPNLRGQR